MKYPKHISKPDEVLTRYFKEALATSWGVPSQNVTIHHLTINSNNFMIVTTEVKLLDGRIIFNQHEEF